MSGGNITEQDVAIRLLELLDTTDDPDQQAKIIESIQLHNKRMRDKDMLNQEDLQTAEVTLNEILSNMQKSKGKMDESAMNLQNEKLKLFREVLTSKDLPNGIS